LAAVVARLRSFQREMLEEQEKREKAGQRDQQHLLELLRTQTLQVTRRARLLRMALWFFLVAVALLLVCSLTLVLSWFVRPAAVLAALFFVLGLLSMLCGVIAAMMELRGALEPVELEARYVFQTVKPSLFELRSEIEESFPDLPLEDPPTRSKR
jgi:ABC-type multidrug transport system fused ATPase/permease subunit